MNEIEISKTICFSIYRNSTLKNNLIVYSQLNAELSGRTVLNTFSELIINK